MLAKTWRKFGG